MSAMKPRGQRLAAAAYVRIKSRGGFADTKEFDALALEFPAAKESGVLAKGLALDFSLAKEYGALAHKLPAMILQNGLAQATGFLLAKGSKKHEHGAVLDDLAAVMSAAEGCLADSGSALHAEIIAADMAATMRLTRCALEASGWLKRYVQGVLKVDATGEEVTS